MTDSTNCIHCKQSLGDKAILCHTCFFKLPAYERVGLRRMFVRGQPLGSKMQKCLRILKEQETNKPTTP